MINIFRKFREYYISEITTKKGGELYAYPDGVENDVVLIPPKSRSVVMMDGAQIVHGTTVYFPSKQPPMFLSDKNSTDFELKFDRNMNEWRVLNDDGVPTQHSYSWGDVRASIAYRSLCFRNEKEMNSWNEYESDLKIDDILEIFKDDLVKDKGIISENEWDLMSKYKLGLFLRNYYIKLPSSEKAWIPYDYTFLAEAFCDKTKEYSFFSNSYFLPFAQYFLC